MSSETDTGLMVVILTSDISSSESSPAGGVQWVWAQECSEMWAQECSMMRALECSKMRAQECSEMQAQNAVRYERWNAARNRPWSKLRLVLGLLLVLRLSFRKRLTLRLTIRLILPNGLVLVIQKRLGLSLLTFRHEIGLVLQNRLTLL